MAEKLTRDKFVLWRTQVLPAVRGALLTGFIDGMVKAPPSTIKTTDAEKKETILENPECAKWMV